MKNFIVYLKYYEKLFITLLLKFIYKLYMRVIKQFNTELTVRASFSGHLYTGIA